MLREKQETERVLRTVPFMCFKNNTETSSLSGGYTHVLGRKHTREGAQGW